MNAISPPTKLSPCNDAKDCAIDTPSKRRSHVECASLGKIQWFVGLSQPMLERLAVRDLAMRGFIAWLPLVQERRPCRPRALLSRKQRRESATTMIVETPMFPRYFFVQFDAASDDWSEVLKTDGVKDLIRDKTTGRPRPVPGLEIDMARATADEHFIPAKLIPDLAAGSPLVMLNGPFLDHQGVCLWSSEKRVRVLLTLFGRKREVMVDRADVVGV